MNALSRKIMALGVSMCLSFPALTQINNTIYFMQGVPQANRINPAYQPDCGFYFGVPLVAPARGGASFSSMTYGDAIQKHPTEDSLITFLHPLADRGAVLDRLKPVNLVVSNLGTSLLSVGFRTEVGFFSLDVSSRFDGNLTYPGDLVHLLVEGTQEGKRYTFDGMGAELSLFSEIALGWSRALSDRLSIGARAKLLFGMGDFHTRSSEFSLTTSRESWDIISDMQFSTSLGFADVVYNEEGLIEDIVIDEELSNMNPYTLARYMFGGGNTGFGVDLGVVYKPIEKLTLSASVVDLAFIRWKKEVHQVGYTMEYSFPGLELNPFDLSEDYTFNDYLDSTLTQISDSLSSFLTMSPGGAYSKRLNTKLYVGGSYQLTPYLGFGLLSRTDFLNGLVAEQVTATANFTLMRLANVALSYSYMNSHFKNFGAGVSFNVGPLNLYLVSDNVLNILIWPMEAHTINVWLGLNFTFGYKDKLDYPLIQ